MNKQDTLLGTIKNIPELIQIQLDNFESIFNSLEGIQAQKINVVASGTSYNSALAVKVIAWKKYKINIEVFYPNFFYNNFSSENFEENVPYIFISQGGKTKSIIESIERVKSFNGLTISLTEKIDSPVASASDIALEIGSKDEAFMFRTAGYTLSVYTLYLITLSIYTNNGMQSKEQLFNEIQSTHTLPGLINDTVTYAENWYQENKNSLTKVKTLYIAGGSELYPVSLEADIKLMEMVPIASNSFEIEEIIHGPQNSFEDSIGFFMLVNNRNDLDKAESIQEFLTNEIHAFSSIITLDDLSDIEHHVILASDNEDLVSIIFISFMQTVSYHLAVDRGRDLNIRLNSSIDKYFSKSV